MVDVVGYVCWCVCGYGWCDFVWLVLCVVVGCVFGYVDVGFCLDCLGYFFLVG